MTTTDPAERLRKFLSFPHHAHHLKTLDAALTAERRATVERIRDEIHGRSWPNDHDITTDRLDAILDAEAER